MKVGELITALSDWNKEEEVEAVGGMMEFEVEGVDRDPDSKVVIIELNQLRGE